FNRFEFLIDDATSCEALYKRIEKNFGRKFGLKDFLIKFYLFMYKRILLDWHIYNANRFTKGG
ncbi:hypothetical protein PVM66_13310, partial [Bacillus licheniformis]|uniref:hypothetical protein n=1 Tax=Bacillus licheniformis TaxID=1402 RepID=UPI00237CFC4A